ncbi:6-hydroxy-D-nicotine oxidase [Penicillium alfredii]|uniref:6-hydroxy-D-nicotine oxidase n=1 Tax=Penicillium alfredii TaxID=1506179 RepID=A0A9W9JZL2_9EURO|nr:6-hydroxy-D-nicotine oxidase [Penicillium alfredii]KAJ5086747.1 6-hydroxy-D-nicotine oxidase [Penicillium alfredii]
MPNSQSSVEDRLRQLMPSLSVYIEGRHYQDCLELYNRALKKEPLVCARPRTEEEVSGLVQFCTEKKIPFAVRSGGHDFFGRSVVHKGILIDMRDVDTVSIGSDRAHARVGGGVIAGHLQETLNSHGLFTPTGQAKSVGYVSWACGGGYGFYVGTYGFGVDQILGARVVLAGGRVVDTDEDSELLWALRGTGAGTFGIVTELRVKVYPVPKLYAGFLAFPLAEAATVMDRIERLLDGNFPDEFSGDAIAVNPEMAPTTVAEPCLVLFWCWTSPSEDLGPARSFLEQTTQAGRVLGNTVTETLPAAYGLGDSSSGTFFRSRNVNRIHQNVGTILARHPPPHPLSAVIFHNNHGRGVRHRVADTVGAAFPNRYQHVILGLHGATRPGRADEQELASAARWVIEVEEALDQNGLSLPGGFPAFWPPDQVDIDRFFGEEKALRLRQLKARLDPNNLFHQALPGLNGF